MSPRELVARVLDGAASPEEIAELDRLLAADPATADLFARAARREGALRALFEEERGAARFRPAATRRRAWIAAGVAAVLLSGAVVLFRGERVLKGPDVLRWDGGATTITLREGAEAVVLDDDPKSIELRRGELAADVAPQKEPLRIRTPHAEVAVLGTKFTLSAERETRLEVSEGRVRFRAGEREAVDVDAGRVARSSAPAPVRAEIDRFLELYRKLHDPANGYFSPDKVPYHAVETLIVDAPDHGHLTTSETFSYWVWLEAAYGRITGDWAPYRKAWEKLEEVAIPKAADQPSLRLYDARKPMSAMAEPARIEEYPAGPDPSLPVGEDPLALRELYVMHWLIDADNVYGFGRRGDGRSRNGFVNTFQRGPHESVWETIPHPSWDARASHVGFFVKSGVPQWRYSCAPDAEARAIQAAYWAEAWATPGTPLHQDKVARMGDALRYALHDKRFRGEHGLIGWAFGWGGSIDEANGWSWRTGAGQAHVGYQNPLAAWHLAKRSPDWARSLEKQLAMYAELQSPEGALAGGYDIDGPSLRFNPHPVFLDPPSNEWFGWQAWSLDRLAQYLLASGDARARPVVERWTAWLKRVVRATPGGYAIPATLGWEGRSVRVTGVTEDVGVAGATARALAFAGAALGDSEARGLSKALLAGIWAHRDAKGVSNPEERADYARFHEKVPHPKGATTFLELRPWFKKDPLLGTRRFRYHRFWAQVEVAVAYAEYARLFSE